jgi:hypothetical protein
MFVEDQCMYVCGMHVYIRIAMHTYTGIYVLDVHTNYVQTHCVYMCTHVVGAQMHICIKLNM